MGKLSILLFCVFLTPFQANAEMTCKRLIFKFYFIVKGRTEARESGIEGRSRGRGRVIKRIEKGRKEEGPKRRRKEGREERGEEKRGEEERREKGGRKGGKMKRVRRQEERDEERERDKTEAETEEGGNEKDREGSKEEGRRGTERQTRETKGGRVILIERGNSERRTPPRPLFCFFFNGRVSTLSIS